MEPTRFVAIILAGVCANASEPVPDKTVVLTFDDAVKSHLTVVAPMLQEYGFGATFFISHAWMNDTEYFLAWEEVAALHKMGFEIANHTWTHGGCSTPRAASRLAGELALVENELAKVGVPKPISFGWPGNTFGPAALPVLEQKGYKLARRGMQPEAPYGTLELGPLFDPLRYHALLIPSAGDAYPNWDLAHFKKVVDRTGEGKIAVVQFHGVPDERHPWVHTPVERFREYMDYLKTGGFHVIALRDVLPYLPEEPVKNDPMCKTLYGTPENSDLYWPIEALQTREHLNFWLENMIRYHAFSMEEVGLVTAMSREALEERIASLKLLETPRPLDGGAVCKVLPYPGGRHPRIGFLEGAIDPFRGTKVSIFPPWKDAGYVVLDLPEAIFSNLGLLFLAHTHVPTIWNAENAVIENRDWIINADGSLGSEWRLPNGVVFGASVISRGEEAGFELWLENGTDEELTGLRTQICLLLKGAPGFNEQNDERKQFEAPLAAVKARGCDRWILLAFDRCKRAWGNKKSPCIHSDPVLPDAAPGQRVSVTGRLRFYEGDEIKKEIARFLSGMSTPTPL